jgi:hypothetical protein
VRYAGAYHCCRSSSSSPGLLSVTTSLRRYGTAEGSISHLSRHDIARQLGLQVRAVRRAPELLEGRRGRPRVSESTSSPRWTVMTRAEREIPDALDRSPGRRVPLESSAGDHRNPIQPRFNLNMRRPADSGNQRRGQVSSETSIELVIRCRSCSPGLLADWQGTH